MKKSPLIVEDDGYDDDEPTGKAAAKPRQEKLSSNPIVATVQSAMAIRGQRVSIEPEPSPPDQIAQFIDNVFGPTCQQQLGKLLLVALMDRDKTFPMLVAKAIKQIDTVFNRHREIALAPKVKKYVWSLPEPLPPERELKAAIERRFNQGHEFTKDRWVKLRHVCLIPVPTRGRPSKKKHRTR